jgi:uncharacterized protein
MAPPPRRRTDMRSSAGESYVCYGVLGLVLLALPLTCCRAQAGATVAETLESPRRLDERLIEAAAAGDIVRVRALLSAGADVNLSSNRGTAVSVAASAGHVAVLRLLLAHGARRVTVQDGLVEATRATLPLLVSAGADVNKPGEYGVTPLQFAAKCGLTETAKALIANGANVNASGAGGWTALDEAVEWGSPEIARALVAAGARVKADSLVGVCTYHSGDDEALANAKLLLKHGAKVNASYDGWTGLHSAAYYWDVQTAKYLVMMGADASVRRADGSTPFTEALRSRYKYGTGKGIEFLRFLHRDGEVGVNRRDDGGKTPLHWAAYKGDAEMTQLLLGWGAKVNVRDKEGKTPLGIALEMQQEDSHEQVYAGCIRLLRAHGGAE